MITILTKSGKNSPQEYRKGLIDIEVIKPSAMILISAIINGERVKERYLYYSRQEAIKLFKRKYYETKKAK